MAMNASLNLVPFMRLEDVSRGFGASHRVYISVNENNTEKKSDRSRSANASPRRKKSGAAVRTVRTDRAGTSAVVRKKSRAAARRRARAAAAARFRRKALMVLAVMMVMLISCFLLGLKAKPKDEGPQKAKFFTTLTVEYGQTMDDIVEKYCDVDHYKNADAYVSEILKINHIALKTGQKMTVRPGDQLVIPYYAFAE